MKALFVDTAGWMACADGSDPAHARSCAARDSALEGGMTLVTTDFVVDETLTPIRFRLGLEAAAAWWQQVDGTSRLRWEGIGSDRFERGRRCSPPIVIFVRWDSRRCPESAGARPSNRDEFG
jgi:hypothetical protein